MVKEKAALPTKRNSAEPPKAIKGQYAQIVDSVMKAGIEITTGLEDTVEEEAPSSLCPIVEFQKPGDYVVGDYLGVKEGVGPNKSRLYLLRLNDKLTAGVWGSTALDSTMLLWNPPVGSRLQIIYTGDEPTQRGLNPVKTFKVRKLKKV